MTNKRSIFSLLHVFAALAALMLPFAFSNGLFAQEEEADADAIPSASQLLRTPVTTLRIGETGGDIRAPTPNLRDAEAIQRGMDLYDQMNCIGCHAPNGGGGMGPSLSNSRYIYGADPLNIFLSIAQGRPGGMPAWSEMLSHDVIWDIVAYLRSISNDQQQVWGRTVSPDGFTIEQVPAQTISTPDPWAHTRPFSFGRQSPQHREEDKAGSSVPAKAPPAGSDNFQR